MLQHGPNAVVLREVNDFDHNRSRQIGYCPARPARSVSLPAPGIQDTCNKTQAALGWFTEAGNLALPGTATVYAFSGWTQKVNCR
jgi:hypothetical protein